MKRTLIAVAPDSFKGSMTSLEAATRIERGLKRALLNIAVRKIPVADGGEGTVRAMVDATGGRFVRRTVTGPVGRPVKATMGVSGDEKTAVIEMAAASGLALLRPRERRPMRATTRGTGELIRHALGLGVCRILVGIGGSATTDGGSGMARALGVRFRDADGRELPEGGGALRRLDTIDMSGVDPRLAGVTLEVACDVNNPLAGPHGAAAVYGPQKGATPAMVKQLDAGLRRMGRIVKRDVGMAVMRAPGAGAAGGLGAGLVAFAGGTLRPGVDIVMECVGLRRRIHGCSLVVTGEGCMDAQTVRGKTPAGIARVATEEGIPCIAVCGSLGPGAERVRSVGIRAFFSALERAVAEEDLAREAPPMLERCACEVGHLLATGCLVGGFRGRAKRASGH